MMKITFLFRRSSYILGLQPRRSPLKTNIIGSLSLSLSIAAQIMNHREVSTDGYISILSGVVFILVSVGLFFGYFSSEEDWLYFLYLSSCL